MTKLITQYILVDRDTGSIGAKWKVLSIIALSVAAFTSIASSWSFYSFNHGFDPVNDRCIIKALPDITIEVVNGTNITSLSTNTGWGTKEDCDFAVFATLFQGMTSIIWISLFIVCGNGGANKSSESSGVPKPSLIVLPATLYFIAMVILAAVTTPFINDSIAEFCFKLQNKTGQTNDSCRELFNEFSSNYEGEDEIRYSMLSPEWNYLLTLIFAWFTLVAFLVCFMIMILRCCFVVDYELVKVQVDKEEGPLLFKSANESEVSPSTSTNSSINERQLRNTRRRRLKVDEADKPRKVQERTVTFAEVNDEVHESSSSA